MIYLDYAAASPVDPTVLKSMEPYFTDVFYNPSALYKGAREAKNALETARSDVARLLGSNPSEVIFVSGGTESANLAIRGVMEYFGEGELLYSSIEHDAVRSPAKLYENRSREIGVDAHGVVKLDSIKELITENTVLVSVMIANNEIGTLQPIKDIVNLVNYIRKQRMIAGNKMPLYLHTDACQAPLYLDINVARLGIDMMTLNGGKIHGPKQSGILYKKSSVVIKPQITGGGQEWGLRSGTENVAFAVGFAKALQLSEKSKTTRVHEMIKLRDFFMQKLTELFDTEINGHPKHRLANNVHVTFPGVDNERVLFALDDMEICAAAGSACSASSDTSSHVLLALGRDSSYARSSLRFSLGGSTTQDQLEIVLDKLAIALKA